MEYFKRLQHLLGIEKEEDRWNSKEITEKLSVAERRDAGITWYPIAIKDTELGRGDYLTVEVERTTHTDVIHNLRFGMSAALFSQHDAKTDRVEGTISYISGNRLKISLRTDELPDWARSGKLGIDAVFDQNSYTEMEAALKLAPVVAEKREEGCLVNLLTGTGAPTFSNTHTSVETTGLNKSQQQAVEKIITANELAIVHGPPGTGKTTTLVQAIKALSRVDNNTILVVAPSNAAVDLLSEKLAAEGLNVVRIGNPARVNEKQLALTLDSRISAHPGMKEIKKLKKRAAEFRDLAHKYKRSFGKEERDQRKALFAEARNLYKEVERTEQYVTDDILAKAHVLTATLVGAAHYSIRKLRYNTVVIDEAAQALEPACWIPILKAQKVIMAGDHQQLPPTIKSDEAARGGLGFTLLEKCVALYPEAVVMLNEQYRMHDTIMTFSSDWFYGSALRAHASVASHLIVPDDSPLQFIDTAGCGYDEKWEGTSLSNPEEAHFLLTQLERYVTAWKAKYSAEAFPTIGVISPYKHQVEVVKNLVATTSGFQEVAGAIAVNTIDSFQGQERDAIFISLVRSNSENGIGFLADVRRMNVAMTRARKKLVVIGDSATLAQHPFYAAFITYAQEKNCYVSAWELMEF